MCDHKHVSDYTEQIWNVLQELSGQYQWANQPRVIQLLEIDRYLYALDSEGKIWKFNLELLMYKSEWVQVEGPLDKEKK